MIKKTTFFFIAILLLAFIVVPKTTAALSVTPAIRELNLTPGERTTALLELENDGLEAVELTTQVVNYTAKGETGEPDYDLDGVPTGAAIWLEVTEGPVTIAAGDTSEIAVTFDTPANATPGGYYAAVLFNMGETAAAAETGELAIESIIAVPFLATVAGSYTESGSIATFGTVGNETSYSKGPVAFSLRFQNTGDIHLKPTGKMTITNMFGSTVKSVNINEDLGAVLPDTVREFVVPSWTDLGNAFGKYTAEVTLTSGIVSDSASVSFWVLSTVGIVIAVVVVIVIIFLIVLLVSKMGRKSAPIKE